MVAPRHRDEMVRVANLPPLDAGGRRLDLLAEGAGPQRWAVALPHVDALDFTAPDPHETLDDELYHGRLHALSVDIVVSPATAAAATLPPAPDPSRSRRVVAGRYELGAVLGRGGFGVVWSATDRLTGDRVALKRVSALSTAQERQVRRELAALRFARLPGVVRLLDEGRDGADWFLVMDQIDGQAFPGGRTARTWAGLRPVVQRLLETLARVHAVGLVHRDLKPSNVLVDESGRVTVLDFGLATSSATGDGRFLGTPRYASPEQIRGEGVGPASDLFSLGCMILEALGHTLPDPIVGRPDLPDPRLALATAVPLDPAIGAWLAALLAPDPTQRPATALDALQALGIEPALPPALRRLGSTPLAPGDLEALFEGPRSFLHLPTDAAAELWRRTRGRPAEIAVELDAWVRAGAAHWVGDRLQVDRRGLDRLAAGLRTIAGPPRTLPPDAAQLLAILELCWPHATEALVDHLEMDGGLAILIERGLAWRLDQGRIGVAPVIHPARHLSDPDRDAILSQLLRVLPQGHPARIRLLLRLGDQARALAEALGRVRAAGERDALLSVFAELSLGLDLALGLQDGAAVLEALEGLAEVALGHEDPAALDRSLAQIDRIRADGIVLPEDRRLDALEGLLRAARASRRGEADRAMDQLRHAVAPQAPRLQIWHAAVRVEAARLSGPRALGQAIDDLAPWAEDRSTDGTLRRAKLAGWRGIAAYWDGDFAEAARLHLAAATGKTGVSRLASQLNAASAWLEALDLDRAIALATEVARAAAAQRHPHFEARATWIQRAASLRARTSTDPRPDLVEAAGAVGPSVQEPMALTEAAIAWHAQDRGQTLTLARTAAALARSRGNRAVQVLAQGLIAAIVPPDPDPFETWVAQAVACPIPEVALQGIALLALARPLPDHARRHLADWAAARPPEVWHLRLDVLSIDEALSYLAPRRTE